MITCRAKTMDDKFIFTRTISAPVELRVSPSGGIEVHKRLVGTDKFVLADEAETLATLKAAVEFFHKLSNEKAQEASKAISDRDHWHTQSSGNHAKNLRQKEEIESLEKRLLASEALVAAKDKQILDLQKMVAPAPDCEMPERRLTRLEVRGLLTTLRDDAIFGYSIYGLKTRAGSSVACQAQITIGDRVGVENLRLVTRLIETLQEAYTAGHGLTYRATAS